MKKEEFRKQLEALLQTNHETQNKLRRLARNNPTLMRGFYLDYGKSVPLSRDPAISDSLSQLNYLTAISQKVLSDIES